MYNNPHINPHIIDFQKKMAEHRNIFLYDDDGKEYLILYRGTNNPYELENVSKTNVVFRQGARLTDPKSITQQDMDSVIQHIANNENAGVGRCGIDSPFCSYTINPSVAKRFGRKGKDVTTLTILIPMDDIEIIYDTKAHDLTKIPLIIGSIFEDEILVPHGTPIASWGIEVTNEKSQSPQIKLYTQDQVERHIKNLNQESRRSQTSTHFRDSVSKSSDPDKTIAF